jgi:hypothetical protein
MENADREKIEQIIKARKRANTFYLKESKVYQSFVKMEEAAFADKELSKLQKEKKINNIKIKNKSYVKTKKVSNL